MIYDGKSGKLPFQDNSVPKVILDAPDKPVSLPGHHPVSFEEIVRVLKPGGEFWDVHGLVYTKPKAPGG